LVVVAIVIYLIYANTRGTPVATTPPAVTITTTTTTTPGGGNQYKDGIYTGSVENAFYGNIQVAVTISSGTITAVNVPVYPDAPGHTTDVTNSTIPKLKQEALVAQSANVNVVSGATQDSEAFQQSLASALAQAVQS
jgi:uncharacterized protein with FMN-binding domain